VGVPLRADHDFEYDTAEIEAAITPRTVAIFLNTPQNPTGAVLSEQTLREIADIAKRHDSVAGVGRGVRGRDLRAAQALLDRLARAASSRRR
jgi:glutamate/tyrosine decarboxylase-like PLP-dependent enzyme